MTERDVLELAERIAEKLATKLLEKTRGIIPERVYTPEEAAELIGFRCGRRGKTIKEIKSIPYIEVIPGSRKRGYRGSDLIRYLDEQTRVA